MERRQDEGTQGRPHCTQLFLAITIKLLIFASKSIIVKYMQLFANI